MCMATQYPRGGRRLDSLAQGNLPVGRLLRDVHPILGIGLAKRHGVCTNVSMYKRPSGYVAKTSRNKPTRD